MVRPYPSSRLLHERRGAISRSRDWRESGKVKNVERSGNETGSEPVLWLATVAEDTQKHQEKIDEVQIKF